jgi:hypothetical protein
VERAPGAGASASTGAERGGEGGGPARHTRLVVEIALVIVAALLSVYGARERDFWLHLAAGRSILQHGLPESEFWCLAAWGQWPWLGEWLYHAALYLIRDLGGDLGVALLRAFWSGLAMALALALARTCGAGLGATLLATPLALAVVRSRLAARPEQVTLAFVLLTLLVFEHARRSGRDRTLWLLPVQVLWVNLHPGWILGPLIAGLQAVVEALRGFLGAAEGVPVRGRPRPGARRALRWAALALALYAAGAVSPRPLDTLSLRLVRDIHADPMVGTIEELRPWDWAEDRLRPYMALLVVAGAAALLGGRRAWRASPSLVLVALGGLLAGIASYRFRALGAFTVLPPLALALTSRSRPGSEGAGTDARNRLRHGLASGVALLAALAGVIWLAADWRYYPPGVRPILDSVPVRAVALADSLGIEGPVLNTSWYGGYILWVRGEGHPPLQDTRNLGSASLRSRLVRARLDPAALDSLLVEWDFTHAVLEPPMDPVDRLAALLFHRPDWALVFADDAGLLYVRRDRYPALAAARAYQLLTPDYGEMGALASQALADSAMGAALTAELRRARRESPWNARASLWLGLLALSRGEARAALAYLGRVEELAPITPGLALRQGYAHELLGDRESARRAYRRALRDTADAAAAREALERLER